ncbi:MAG: HAD family hydrolase [Betaproteobacteria bacterium HGW-Betaproteobacteria-22]|nr:MAG: HAD family hydrolase [Betaproteobacteria bacterium HGW-Betaproteobacteria-22]
MQLTLKKYQSIVFDCDGVVLDSNQVKTEAYFRTAKQLGATDAQAQALVDYHVKLGGISRYHKFEWYLREVLNQPITAQAVQALLDEFARELEVGLMECAVAEGLENLRSETPQANWMILSGGDQQEIRTLFAKRNLVKYFDGGLFGSPDNKDTVLAREIASGNLKLPALFVGDSKYDFEAATRAGLDFVFLSDWTEVADWQTYCQNNHIRVCANINQLNDCKLSGG